MYVFMERPTVEETDVDELLIPGQRHSDNKMLSVPIEGDYKMISQAIIAEAIQLARGNKSAAARSLGLHRKTLYRIMKDGGHRERN
jgi:DNA-binding NtrC family response regulator